MNTEKLSHWVQIISGIAILIGLVLVLIELRQTKELTRASLASESHSIVMERSTSFQGENPMRVLAKACDSDEPLSTEEKLNLFFVFQSLSQPVYRSYETGRIAQFEDRGLKVPEKEPARRLHLLFQNS